MSEIGGETGSTLPRRQLGRYLLDWRTRAGYTQAMAAELLEMGATSLGRLEKGENSRIKSRDIQAACDLYGVPDDLAAAFIGLARQANVKSWWHRYGDLIPKDFNVYVVLEAAATELISYQPDLVPGLLQTAAYDRALAQRTASAATDDEREQRIQIKMQRQHLVTRKSRPLNLIVVVGEAALHRMAGSPHVMAAQLRHLADMSTRTNISLRVLPSRAGFPTGVSMPPFVILRFDRTARGEPIEPPVVFLEGVVGNMYLENDDDVTSFTSAFESHQQAALDEIQSRDLLRRVAKEFDHER